MLASRLSLGTATPTHDVSEVDFLDQYVPEYGTMNPTPSAKPFYFTQIHNFANENAYLVSPALRAGLTEPIWSFERFGQSLTYLPDGRLILIAGEHEDFYDPDFWIYNDVTVISASGDITHYTYPRDIFPPTDFHTATLVGEDLWIIGSLGYKDARRFDQTQVLRLDLSDFSIHQVVTTGQNPGWIHGHEAAIVENDILITGATVEPGYRALPGSYALNLETLVWREIT